MTSTLALITDALTKAQRAIPTAARHYRLRLYDVSDAVEVLCNLDQLGAELFAFALVELGESPFAFAAQFITTLDFRGVCQACHACENAEDILPTIECHPAEPAPASQ